MPNSLKTKFKKLAHDGKITEDECQELIAKLDGHDDEIKAKAYKQGYDEGYDGAKRFYEQKQIGKCLKCGFDVGVKASEMKEWW